MKKLARSGNTPPTKFDIATIAAAVREVGLLDVAAVISGIPPLTARQWYLKGRSDVLGKKGLTPYVRFIGEVYDARRKFLDTVLHAVLAQVDQGNETAKLWLSSWADHDTGINLTDRAIKHIRGLTKRPAKRKPLSRPKRTGPSKPNRSRNK